MPKCPKLRSFPAVKTAGMRRCSRAGDHQSCSPRSEPRPAPLPPTFPKSPFLPAPEVKVGNRAGLPRASALKAFTVTALIQFVHHWQPGGTAEPRLSPRSSLCPASDCSHAWGHCQLGTAKCCTKTFLNQVYL